MKFTLAISPCPNDTFMFDALINHRIDTRGVEVQVQYLDIEELNTMAQQSHSDISKISYALLPSISDRYTVLKSGSALGRGNGPILVRRRGEKTPIRRVAIPGIHTTAKRLLDRFFPQVEAVPMLFSQIAAAVEAGQFDAGVLIHEGRFTFAQRGLEQVADLGQLWEQESALPLPLGAIVASRRLPAVDIRLFDSLLRQSIEYAFAHPTASREFVKSHAQELSDSVIDSHIALFVNRYSLDIGEDGILAIEMLLGCDALK